MIPVPFLFRPAALGRIYAPIFALLLCLFTPLAHAQEIKVDISNTGRPLSEGWDPAYTAWNTNQNWFAGGDVTANTFSGVTVTLRRVGSVGTALQPNYWKAGVQATAYNVKLTADGIKIANGDTGAQMEMRLSGLAAGSHTVLTYHNIWDSLPAGSFAPLDLSVDGVLAVTNLVMSMRVTNNAAATTAYLTVNAVAGQDVVILMAAETNNAAWTTKNVYLNGFEIDTANSTLKAVSPTPGNLDEHVDGDNKTVPLRWTGAGSAVSHNVFFGTDSNAVKNATTASLQFKGNQTGTNYTATNISSLLTYFWRVDEINALSNVTKGDLWIFRPRHLAFPGAEGYGRFARGGRGGIVVEVSNTNNSGAGSLRDALTGNYGPRTVVFTVSGLFTIDSDVIIGNNTPYITLAGQTAPGKGICVRKYQFGVSGGRDLIIRHVRSRPGNISGTTLNGSGLSGSDNCIMDHVSISWGIDEELSTRSSKNITFQRSLISEALNIAGHQNYPAGTAHGYAASVGGDIASLHHNLLAHNEGRNWSLAGGLDGGGYYSGRLDVFNNVVYNWGHRTTDGGAMQVNFVNNFYKPGAAIAITVALNAQYGGFPGYQQYYFDGNIMPGYWGTNNETAGRTQSTETGGTLPANSTPPYSAWVTNAFFPSYATVQPVTNAYEHVLSDVGCTQPAIDDHDLRVIRETLNGTYTYTGTGPYGGSPGLPNSQDDVGGWDNYPNVTRAANYDSDHDGLPDWWEQIIGTNPNSPANNFADSNADPDGDEYTNLEDYLNWLAAPHTDCPTNSFVDIDLHLLARGLTNNAPTFSVSGATNGSVTLLTNRIARFTPNVGTNALGKFNFSVTDSIGVVLTNTIGIHITTASAPANTAPVLPAISNRTVNVGATMNFTNSATDAEGGALTYTLPFAPTNATLDASSGALNWRPSVTYANSTNFFAIVVTDNGGLSATQNFSVLVNPLTAPSVAAPSFNGTQLNFTVTGQVGPDYALQTSSNLATWSTLFITNSPPATFNWSDTNSDPLRF
ncbi:MAG: hypothetical protein RLZZ350_486, partial [Verrucomicrobiota bacterium]